MSILKDRISNNLKKVNLVSKKFKLIDDTDYSPMSLMTKIGKPLFIYQITHDDKFQINEDSFLILINEVLTIIPFNNKVNYKIDILHSILKKDCSSIKISYGTNFEIIQVKSMEEASILYSLIQLCINLRMSYISS